jgi:ribosomal protein S6--L-glutamate ligase
MDTLIVVNGETDWQPYFPGLEVHQVWLQSSKWLYHDSHLWVFDAAGAMKVERVLWRVGAIKPHPSHRTVLELLRFAQVPCVNPAQVLLRGYDRLAMLHELREARLPVISCSIALGEQMLERLQPTFPVVGKAGNYHGGFGKARLADEAAWVDFKDMAFLTEDYVTIESAIEYVRDIRCLAVGERIWAMERRGRFWKVNTQTLGYQVIEPPALLADYTRQAMQHFQADVLGLDFLETADGQCILLESNDTPGFSGFPDEVRKAVARRMREKTES